MPGVAITEAEWATRTSDLAGCRDLAAPAGIVGQAVMARVCPSNADGWSLIALTGVFSGTGVRCDLIVQDGQVDVALEETVIRECSRIILELAG